MLWLRFRSVILLRHTRSASRGDCVISHRSSSFRKSFSVNSANSWNALPSHVRTNSTYKTFKPPEGMLVASQGCKHSCTRPACLFTVYVHLSCSVLMYVMCLSVTYVLILYTLLICELVLSIRYSLFID